jgi:large subunit ribosomal protein L28
MAARCDICGKEPIFGHSVSHSLKATKRKWRPNLHKVTALIDGKKRKVRVCTKCLRKIQKVV